MMPYPASPVWCPTPHTAAYLCHVVPAICPPPRPCAFLTATPATACALRATPIDMQCHCVYWTTGPCLQVGSTILAAAQPAFGSDAYLPLPTPGCAFSGYCAIRYRLTLTCRCRTTAPHPPPPPHAPATPTRDIHFLIDAVCTTCAIVIPWTCSMPAVPPGGACDLAFGGSGSRVGWTWRTAAGALRLPPLTPPYTLCCCSC